MSLIDRFASMRAGGKKPVLQTKSVTPTASGFDVEPDNGYDGLEKVIVNGDADLISDNVKHNVNIFGVVGTAPTEEDTLDKYFDRTLTNAKYKYSDIAKKNPPLYTSSLTTMQDMFAESDLQAIDTTGFNSTNVTNMSGMCKDSVKLTSFNGIGLSTSNVTTMADMFKNCPNLTTFNFEGFDTSNVTDMSSMFEGDTSLTSLDLSGFNMSSVTNTSKMFYGCTNLSLLNISGWNYSNIATTTDMFTGVPTDCRIVVNDQAEKDWVLSIRADLTNIHISINAMILFGTNDGYYNSGLVIYSFNGLSWNNNAFGSLCVWDICSNGSRLVAYCSRPSYYDKIYYSDNVTDWTVSSVSIASGGGEQSQIAYGNNLFVFIRPYGSNYSRAYVYTSTDGENWITNEVAFTNGNASCKIASSGSIFLTCGNWYGGYVYTSTDGVNWTYRSNPFGTNVSLINIFYLNNQFHLLCSRSNPNEYAIYSSSDNGVSWTKHDLSFSPYSIGYGNGMYILNGAYYSYDLDTFYPTTPQISTYNTVRSIGYGFEKFVAYDYYGGVKVSTDGTSWQTVTGTPTRKFLTGCKYFEL